MSVIALVFSCGSAFAAWEQNGICIADSGEEMDVMFIAPDPACGASVLWQSNSHIGGSCGIGVAKFDWNGLDQWEGSVSCPTYRCVGAYDLISDGGMGVFALTGGSNYYEPDPFSSVCINRISGDGAVSETSIATFDYYTTDRARLIPDGQSGAIAVWNGRPSGETEIRLYAQRYGTDLEPLWTEGGIELGSGMGDRRNPALCGDGGQGAIVVWEDHRSGLSLSAQKLDFAGLPAWPAGGVQVDSNHENGLHTEIISDGGAGAIIVWDETASGDRDIFAQRVSSDGTPLWGPEGITVCDETGDQEYPLLTGDGLGGAIIKWRDARSGDHDVYAQRVSASGEKIWAYEGLPVAAGPGDQNYGRIVENGSGGAIFAWVDDSGSDPDIYARNLSGEGADLWGTGFVPVCTADNAQTRLVMTRDCIGGAVMAWTDYRNSVYGEVWAMRIYDPHTGDAQNGPSMETVLANPRPNPFNPRTSIDFELASRSRVIIEIFDVEGRRIRRLLDRMTAPGGHTVNWDGKDDQGRRMSSGVYFCRFAGGGRCLTRKMIMLR